MVAKSGVSFLLTHPVYVFSAQGEDGVGIPGPPGVVATLHPDVVAGLVGGKVRSIDINSLTSPK